MQRSKFTLAFAGRTVEFAYVGQRFVRLCNNGHIEWRMANGNLRDHLIVILFFSRAQPDARCGFTYSCKNRMCVSSVDHDVRSEVRGKLSHLLIRNKWVYVSVANVLDSIGTIFPWEQREKKNTERYVDVSLGFFSGLVTSNEKWKHSDVTHS